MASLDSEISEESWRVREVFAAFGLAVYQSNCLEQSLQVLLLTAWSDRPQTRDDYDAGLEVLGKRTFGQLLQIARSRSSADATLVEQLEAALDTRNRLAHRYFEEHAAAFMFVEGQEQMRSELHDIAGRLQALHGSISVLIRDWGRQRGIEDQDYDEAQSALLDEYRQQR